MTAGNEIDEKNYKVVLVGAARTGKTALFASMVKPLPIDEPDKQLEKSYSPTIGATYQLVKRKYKSKKEPVSEYSVQFEMWDTAANLGNQEVMSHYLCDSSAILVCFSYNSPSTFLAATTWIKKCRQVVPQAKIVLVSTQSDLKIMPEEAEGEAKNKQLAMINKQLAMIKEVESFAKKKNITYIETSAKTGHNVEALLKTVAKTLLREEKLKNQPKVKTLMTLMPAKVKATLCCPSLSPTLKLWGASLTLGMMVGALVGTIVGMATLNPLAGFVAFGVVVTGICLPTALVAHCKTNFFANKSQVDSQNSDESLILSDLPEP